MARNAAEHIAHLRKITTRFAETDAELLAEAQQIAEQTRKAAADNAANANPRQETNR